MTDRFVFVELGDAAAVSHFLGRVIGSLVAGLLPAEALGAAHRLADILVSDDAFYLDLVPTGGAGHHVALLQISDASLELAAAFRAAQPDAHGRHRDPSRIFYFLVTTSARPGGCAMKRRRCRIGTSLEVNLDLSAWIGAAIRPAPKMPKFGRAAPVRFDFLKGECAAALRAHLGRRASHELGFQPVYTLLQGAELLRQADERPPYRNLFKDLRNV